MDQTHQAAVHDLYMRLHATFVEYQRWHRLEYGQPLAAEIVREALAMYCGAALAHMVRNGEPPSILSDLTEAIRRYADRAARLPPPPQTDDEPH